MSRCLFHTVLLQVRDPRRVVGSMLGFMASPGAWTHHADAVLRLARYGASGGAYGNGQRGGRAPLPGAGESRRFRTHQSFRKLKHFVL